MLLDVPFDLAWDSLRGSWDAADSLRGSWEFHKQLLVTDLIMPPCHRASVQYLEGTPDPSI